MGLIDLSASQIKLAEDCLARWGAKYLGGLEEEETSALREGKLDHGQLEDWSTLRKVPTRPRALKGLPFAGVPGTRNVELAFRVESPDSPWRGFIDQIFSSDGGAQDRKVLDADTIVIQDWKTTSKLEYAKTVEDLVDDAQVNLYGYYVHKTYQPVKVEGRWVYLPTTGDALVRSFEIDKQKAVDVVEGRLGPTARKLQVLYDEKPDWKTLDKNTGFCHSFGRLCPRYTECAPERKFKLSLFGANKPMTTDFATSVENSFPGVQKKAPPGPPKKQPPAPPYKMKNEIPKDLDTEEPKIDSGFVNPPGEKKVRATPAEALQDQPDLEAEAEAEGAHSDELEGLDAKQLLAIGVAEGAVPAKCKSRAPALKAAIRAHREKQRLTGEAPAGAYTQEMTEEFTEAQFNPPVEEPVRGAKGPTTGDRFKIVPRLFINCRPMFDDGCKQVHTNELLDLANQYLYDNHPEQPVDYRMIPYDGRAQLAVALQKIVTDTFDTIIIDTRTPEGADMQNTLVSICKPYVYVG